MNAVLLKIRAYPRASRNRVIVTESGLLQVYVTAAPEDNKANTAIIATLSKLLKVAKSNIEIVSGLQGRDKKVKVSNVSEKIINQRLELLQADKS
ncbi:MAG TPA: DUF167 domain-containing protein [Candidatus Hydrogenedentes bacterium]|nr:MAG: hypothetical protein BWY07_00287 [Candidatus Hydrogenedentes bacterium ADurb.Bin170]HNZ47220.1 DUF167 domain-containing protein [Candidatus Hydrogenedentota bacterium]HOD94520.1 DUF167 domain-containing protein [Candidatus Hydrogenedentota bacterium]HOH42975.1 DUF167 domain-containing protein [Candidatus Hydrogenedentota bacterium]HOM47825.1 DUF167 domain-containing protein [Candidatus Hydrogenedentota bacterium]